MQLIKFIFELSYLYTIFILGSYLIIVNSFLFLYKHTEQILELL